jgi:hypothetical protein
MEGHFCQGHYAKRESLSMIQIQAQGKRHQKKDEKKGVSVVRRP